MKTSCYSRRTALGHKYGAGYLLSATLYPLSLTARFGFAGLIVIFDKFNNAVSNIYAGRVFYAFQTG
jgi:hypothetical protein